MLRKGFSEGRKNQNYALPEQYELLNSDIWGKLRHSSRAHSTQCYWGGSFATGALEKGVPHMPKSSIRHLNIIT